MSRWMVGLVALVSACSSPAPRTAPAPPPRVVAPSPPPSVEPAFDPPQPTLRLPRHFTPTSYAARLAIDPARPTFEGTIEITGDLARRSAVIWLDGKGLTVHEAHATRDGTTVPIVVTVRGEDFLELRPATPLAAGRWVVAVSYSGTFDAQGTAGAWVTKIESDAYVVTQFESMSARNVFPCLDEPDRKTPWKLTLDVPSKNVAVSNTPIETTAPIDAGHDRVTFAVTKPLPSYLVAFAVGPFQIVDAGKAKSGLPIRIIVPRTMADRVGYLTAVEPRIVDAIEGLLAVPFPYPKLDVVVRPRDFGAMENAGMITLEATSALLDREHPSWALRHNIVTVAGHETAHQWFGDLVTAAWWDDIWLNESFATWMEPKLLVAVEPSWHDEHETIEQRANALFWDSKVTARAIRQPVETAADVRSVFDGIVYPKGASVLRLFERYLGPDVFLRGVRGYLQRHAHGNATSADLIAALDEASGQKLDAAFATFLDQGGVPELEVRLACPAGAPATVTLAQHRYLIPGSPPPPGGTPWTIPVCFAYERGGKRVDQCALVDQPTTELALPGTGCPSWILPNAGGGGYYVSAMSATLTAALRDRAWPLMTALERRGMFDDLRREVLLGRTPVGLLMSLVPRQLASRDRHAVGDAIWDHGLPFELYRHVPATRAAAVGAFVRRTLGARARELGYLPRAKDDIDDELSRAGIVRVVARGGDRTLVADAISLAAKYRELPESARGLVLAIAADASTQVSERLHREVLAEPDVVRREQVLAALAAIRDPARLRAQLDLMLDPRFTISDLGALAFVEPNQTSTELQWLYDHYAELSPRIPTGDDFSLAALFPFALANLCEPARRDEVTDYVMRTFAVVPNVARYAKEALEGMDQCIAQRALVQPSLGTWLSDPGGGGR